MSKIFLFCLAGILAIGCTVSCKSGTAYEDERICRALVEHYRSVNLETNDGKPLSLDKCIAAGMTNTLAARFRSAAEKKADPRFAVEVLEMLPSLRFQNGLHEKSNAPSPSSLRPNFYNVDIMIGLLDFGLGYWYTQENLYKTNFREQLMRQTANKIRFETARAFYRAGALQTVIFQLELQLEKLRVQSGRFMKGKGDPALAAKVLRKLAKLEQALYKSEEAHKNACVELRSLMGLYPVPDVNLDMAQAKREPRALKLPALSFMEQIALCRRPELYMGDLKKALPVSGCYDFIKQVLPELPGKEQYSSEVCSRLGTRALYDLLQTPDRIARRGARASATIESIHSYAAALAVMAQVRMAYSEYSAALALYKKAATTLTDSEKLLKRGRAGTVEYADMLLDTLQAKLEKEEAALRCRIAENRLYYVMGVPKLDDRIIDTIREELSDARLHAVKDLAKARLLHSKKEFSIMEAERKKLEKEEAERLLQQDEMIRKETNKEIDKKFGSQRNPALWNEMSK